jgi:hypothetical protein
MQDLRRSVQISMINKSCWLPIVSLLLVMGVAPMAEGEIYSGIGPTDTLADLKRRFPNANFEELHPAWANESELLYKMSGLGIAGEIVVKLDDSVPYYRQMRDAATDEDKKKLWQDLIDKPDQAKTVAWVRWVPASQIPVQRLIAKFGKPDDQGFRDEDMSPYRFWKRGVTALLSDDQKFILHIDYYFTEAEIVQADCKTYGICPPPSQPAPTKHKRSTKRAPNSPQKLARPGFGPPAEPARNVKIARRHAARIRAPHMRRAACRSGFGTWALAVQLSV